MSASDFIRTIPLDLEVRADPRPPIEDPTLGIDVRVLETDTPVHRLVTIGDSLTQGFMSGAIFRTELSWPAIVAYELGLAPRTHFHLPVYEQPDGPGGLPLDLERFARAFEARYGPSLDWREIVPALQWLRSYMDEIEDYWERGPGNDPPSSTTPYQNLAVYGWDILDAQLLDADRVDRELADPPRDDLLRQLVNRHGTRAARVVLDSCRSNDGAARTVLQAAQAMGDQGAPGEEPGIETLVVMLGSNNALGSIVQLAPRWTPDNYTHLSPNERMAVKGACNVWQPAHFAAEWADLVDRLKTINSRHVILATIPHVTIAPIARGVGGKAHLGSRYFKYYTRPWITDHQFDERRDPYLTSEEARTIDSAVDAFNETIIESVKAARQEQRDWYLFDLGSALDRLAARRYLEDPVARPAWWTPYPLPRELTDLDPVPDTRFFRSGPTGRAEGGIFSLDGIHPTTTAYGLIAQEIIQIMDQHAGVRFSTPTGEPRPAGTVHVDFGRLLAADSLLSRPPKAISGTLSLLGWLDDQLDWVKHILPFV